MINIRKLLLISILMSIPQICIAEDAFEEFYEHMNYLSERDKILSQNIANVDTPQYKPRDIKKNQNKGLVDNIKLKRTNNMHMDISSDTDYELFSPQIDEIKPNGNAVNLQRELFKKNENSQKLTEVTNIYSKSKNIMHIAIQGLNR